MVGLGLLRQTCSAQDSLVRLTARKETKDLASEGGQGGAKNVQLGDFGRTRPSCIKSGPSGELFRFQSSGQKVHTPQRQSPYKEVFRKKRVAQAP